MPLPYVSRPAAARVDTARLRGILADHTQAYAYATNATLDGRAADAARGIRQAVYSSRIVIGEVPALLDELDAARALIRDVLEHGLSSVEPLRARALYARLEAAVREG